MKALFDTSVLVAAVVAAHPAHGRALPWLRRAHEKEIEAFVSAHTLAELYAVLSTLPVRPRISPLLARQLVQENVERRVRVVPLTARDYGAVLTEMASRGVPGGVGYDALAVRACRKAGAERLLTLNRRDFLRVWPEGSDIVVEP